MLDRVVRLGLFVDPLKHLIHQMKYHRRWPLAEFLADRLSDQPRVRGLLTEADCLVAVPLFVTRHIGRGYNQAELIARRLTKRNHKKLARPLSRLRPTETQTNLHSHAKRIENVRDAFGLIDARCVCRKHVVLVDDVMTSGATLQAAARALRPAKPASVCAIVVAVADPKGRGFELV